MIPTPTSGASRRRPSHRARKVLRFTMVAQSLGLAIMLVVAVIHDHSWSSNPANDPTLSPQERAAPALDTVFQPVCAGTGTSAAAARTSGQARRPYYVPTDESESLTVNLDSRSTKPDQFDTVVCLTLTPSQGIECKYQTFQSAGGGGGGTDTIRWFTQSAHLSVHDARSGMEVGHVDAAVGTLDCPSTVYLGAGDSHDQYAQPDWSELVAKIAPLLQA